MKTFAFILLFLCLIAGGAFTVGKLTVQREQRRFHAWEKFTGNAAQLTFREWRDLRIGQGTYHLNGSAR